MGFLNGHFTTDSGSGGGSALFYSAVAGENLSANQAVYICISTSDNVGGARTVGQIYKLDVTMGYRMVFAGFVTAAVTAGATATVQIAGEMTGFTGLNVGQQIWASTSTPGSFQLTAPLSSSLILPLGQGSTTTGKLLINAALFATNSGTQPGFDSFTALFFAGGGSALTSTDKLTLSSETVSALGSSLPTGINESCGASGSDRSYAMGRATRANQVQKLTHSSETWSNLGAILGTGIHGAGGTQSSTNAYRIGGDDASATTSIEKILFSTDTRSSVSATLASARRALSGASSSVAGYVFGGRDSGGTETNTINKLTFSGETTSVPSATLSNNTTLTSATYSSTAGYREGGLTGSTVIDRLLFATDVVTTLAATLTQAYSTATGASGSLKGYVAGGAAANTVINALTFATETNAASSAALTVARDNVPTGLRK